VSSTVAVSQQHFNGECESADAVWECPAYTYTTESQYNVVKFDEISAVSVDISPFPASRDYYEVLQTNNQSLFSYFNGKNIPGALLPPTLPQTLAIHSPGSGLAIGVLLWFLPQVNTFDIPAPLDPTVSTSGPGSALKHIFYTRQFTAGDDPMNNQRIHSEVYILDKALDEGRILYDHNYFYISWYDTADNEPASDNAYQVWRQSSE